jgi:hypothetical protein
MRLSVGLRRRGDRRPPRLQSSAAGQTPTGHARQILKIRCRLSMPSLRSGTSRRRKSLGLPADRWFGLRVGRQRRLQRRCAIRCATLDRRPGDHGGYAKQVHLGGSDRWWRSGCGPATCGRTQDSSPPPSSGVLCDEHRSAPVLWAQGQLGEHRQMVAGVRGLHPCAPRHHGEVVVVEDVVEPAAGIGLGEGVA